ncbi:MAG: hypothetical protein AAFY60_21730, partial [Myxococcota bacterium]
DWVAEGHSAARNDPCHEAVLGLWHSGVRVGSANISTPPTTVSPTRCLYCVERASKKSHGNYA